MKLSEALLKAEQILKNQGIEDFISDARFLVSGFLNKSYSYLKLNPGKEIDFEKIIPLLERRIKGEPCQYITGSTEFMGLTFKVNKSVLIPRQDTENLVEHILDSENGFKGKILDVCTGSGAIAVSLKKLLKNAEVSALDISEEALETARENAKLNDAEINFFQEDILKLTSFSAKYDIIVSNPPYIESEVIKTLACEVKDFEPMIALDGGADGLLFYRKISSLLKSGLKKGGRIYFEIGHNQGKAVSEILINDGFSNVKIIKDYNLNQRIVKGKLL